MTGTRKVVSFRRQSEPEADAPKAPRFREPPLRAHAGAFLAPMAHLANNLNRVQIRGSGKRAPVAATRTVRSAAARASVPRNAHEMLCASLAAASRAWRAARREPAVKGLALADARKEFGNGRACQRTERRLYVANVLNGGSR